MDMKNNTMLLLLYIQRPPIGNVALKYAVVEVFMTHLRMPG